VSGRLIEAQEKERSRIARELHDDICQRLALLSMELEQANRNANAMQTNGIPRPRRRRSNSSNTVRRSRAMFRRCRINCIHQSLITWALRPG
jgi:signal transduction histidine kinase